ncbi:Asp23/Gls24 family envelope stress response protein [Paenarthrobacter sp. Z7-10]|uniref:Asp23/Gls24 family envelope stress response protein n=1 Tax=Paenarthrobacter sp. Z7-10 TaxID=2787635 RepID=UPI0022A9A0AD|nr:Asp23/Gls24 family envelope stress response protein [Paenarthrobacter sp. Z7-10]MCZ2403349.1 Asp23/Gls24 family envelope stress response protein [Paenarthrobacter sp. Z7-10]
MDGQTGSHSPFRPDQQPPFRPGHRRSPHSAAGTGRTIITDAAVAKVAAVAARSVEGVHALGAGSVHTLGSIREAAGAGDLTQGVRAEAGETEAAVDITLVAEFGRPLQLLADQVRAAVYAAVENLVGLRVIEVNVEISNVYISGYEHDKPRTRSRLGTGPSVSVPPGRVQAQHAMTGTQPLDSKEQP